MTSDDWYLHANWSEEDQQEFFKRIKRARAKKAFIIRAKANVLFFTGQREQIEAAIALYQYGIATCPNSDLLTSLHLMIARSYEALGHLDQAVAAYQKVLALEKDETLFVRSTKAWSYFSLLAVTQQMETLYDEILSILQDVKLFLVEQEFIAHACQAIIFNSKGNTEAAQQERLHALAPLQMKHSSRAPHKKLDLINAEGFKRLMPLLEF